MKTITYRRKFKHFCKDCVNFKENLNCSDVKVKNAEDYTDYCLWGEDKFKWKEDHQ